MENAISQREICVACSACSWVPLGEKDGYLVYRCGQCATISILPTPMIETDLYGQSYFAASESGSGYVNYDEDKEAMRPEIERALGALETFTAKGRLLDVGAATGFLLDIARARGWEGSGIEISEYAANLARKKGLDVVTGTLASAKLTNKKFEAIVLWDVIEHVPDPNADLRLASDLLGNGGVLLLVTPDASSWYARLRGLAWHLLVPPEHINCFSRAGLRALLGRAGFDVLSVGAPKKVFPLAYSLHVISRVTKLAFLDRLSRLLSGTWLGRVHVPLDVRDNMIVYARKRS